MHARTYPIGRPLGRTLIVGAGYTGMRLKCMLEQHRERYGCSQVIATKHRAEDDCLAFDWSQAEAIDVLAAEHGPWDTCIITASPARALGLIDGLSWLKKHMRPHGRIIGIISTATYGIASGEVTELTPPQRVSERHHIWGSYDDRLRALSSSDCLTTAVRTPAIYGPGRDHIEKIKAGRDILPSGGGCTSRIHVDDLAGLLLSVASHVEHIPCMLATDQEPATTYDVLQYVVQRLGCEPPPEMDLSKDGQISQTRYEMWKQDRRCRSLMISALYYQLKYPTYREGIDAAIAEYNRL